MNYVRMPIEIESPEQIGYENIKYNLTESSVTDLKLGDLNINLQELCQIKKLILKVKLNQLMTL